MKNFIRGPALAVALFLGACAGMPVPQAGFVPPRAFVLEDALSGHLTGQGVITPIIGASTSFDVTIAGTWDGKVLTLVEDFKYPSGTTERKTWHLTKSAAGDYVGTREDVIGQAHAFVDGPTVRLDYRVKLDTPLGRTARFQDVLYWEDDRTIRNVATVSKLGLRLARVSLRLVRAGK